MTVDSITETIDINTHLIKHRVSTFFVRAAGTSMLGAGIHPGDLLIVDRALEVADKKVVIAVVDGGLTVKRLRIRGERVTLGAENEGYPPIEITGDMGGMIWGVVTYCVHQL